MTQLNTLLGVLVGTLIFANMASAKTIEIEKAQPIDHKAIHAAVELQLKNTIEISAKLFRAKELPINSLSALNNQEEDIKTLNIAKTDYLAD